MADFLPKWRDSFVFSSRREENRGVASVEPSASDCPPDSRTLSCKSCIQKIKAERVNALSAFMYLHALNDTLHLF